MSRSSRRGFLRNLFLASEQKMPDAGAKTLVCVFLRGGADMLNLVVPYGDDQYYSLRPSLSIPRPNGDDQSQDAAIRLDEFYAFHPKLRPLLPIYREGRLGIVQAVGSDNPTGSHFEAQDQMEHGEAYGRTIGGGWLGRYLRTRAGKNMTPLSGVAIGPTIPESLRSAPSASAIDSLEDVQIKTPSGDPRAVSLALSAMYGAEAGVLGQPGRATLELLNRVESLRGRAYIPESGADYPAGSFGAGLREIARLVKACVGLEVACIDLGGWDTHFFQGTTDGLQAGVIDELARGLSAFDTDLARHRDDVITIVITEFGRRIYENASLGTDHGRAFAFLAMGGRVKGGRVTGVWPGLEEEDSPGPGGLKVMFDYRSVLSEVLSASGCRNISQVFPGFKPQPIGLV
ncbi:MAG: DUF1501 domain-containing protein [Blastocatellia bacterium]|nr:DUF1501 domain-containing protein [Blastocatellia bacterium]